MPPKIELPMLFLTAALLDGEQLRESHRGLKQMVAYQATKLAPATGRGSQFDAAITSTAFGTNDIGLLHGVTSDWEMDESYNSIRILTESGREASVTKPVHCVHNV